MAHDPHAAPAGDEHAHPHPALPPVHDEAPDTPMWLPITGLALLGVVVLVSLFRAASASEAAPATDVVVDAPAEAPAGAALPE